MIVTFTFEGETFTLTREGTSLGADGGERLRVLGAVVASAWLYGPEALLASVEARTGRSFEGVVSFGFPDGDEFLGPGVALAYLDEELVVEERVFRAFVRAFGGAALELDRRFGVEQANAAALARRLDALVD
ncbi:MAG TPA: hypothetical protein VFF06_12180 [Polyangia bacterium]|nr:hypothetical protein [Polyangia bacterium]